MTTQEKLTEIRRIVDDAPQLNKRTILDEVEKMSAALDDIMGVLDAEEEPKP